MEQSFFKFESSASNISVLDIRGVKNGIPFTLDSALAVCSQLPQPNPRRYQA
jgi:hypothetical protein